MKDREIFQNAVHELPSLILPLFVTLGIMKVIEYGVSFLIARSPVLLFRAENGILALIGLILLFNFFLACVSCLMTLGCYRLCLDRGCGKKGTMPWTIFRQSRKYKSWILWMGLVPALWKTGKIFLRNWMIHSMTMEEYYRFSSFNNNLFVVMFIANILLLMLLQMSVRTAYLRAPEQGFWHAVFFGIKEGLQKWPKTIGPHLKYVISVMFLFRMISGYVISPLLSKTGTHGALFITEGLQMADTIWTMVLYGFLAAERYDPPEQEVI